jgi:uroporphyrinogen III methyltransferase/synthase
MSVGTVFLIGAGPGDPGLITVRGVELLRLADVVIYDRLAHPALLLHARPEAEIIYVGKASAHHAMRQEEINALLVDRAQQGFNVARLKGGDPVVFGRGGEEAEYCRAAGVPFEFVPGVTSAIAAPTYAGIPITHRDAASSFAVVTGHERDDRGEAGSRLAGKAEQRRNWATLAHAADTLIFLMGVEALPEIAARLQEHGRSPETPVALVQWGTWPAQRVVTGTLSSIVEAVRAAGLTPPAVCVVGDVVSLRPGLRWFDDPDTRPLFGKRIVVTRAREQASALSDLLRRRGAEPVEFPVIKIDPMPDYGALDYALSNLSRFSWMIVTSVNAVPIIATRLETLGLDARNFAGVRIAAIGPATAQAVRTRLGLRADFVPGEAVAEAMLDQWPDPDLTGQRILLPRALEAREILPEQLRARGAKVEVIPVYRTVADTAATENFRAQLAANELDVLTFTASSTVDNFAKALAVEGETLSSLIGNALVASIGPITADTLRSYGVEPQIVAPEHTIPGLVNAIEHHLSGEQNQCAN